jgi:hypothetical protein
MLNSHVVARAKAPDEYRVLLIGDSGIWGWLLENDDTLAAQLNAAGLRTAGGKRLVVYNLGYPLLSTAKDLLLLDAALAYQPDLIVWPLTLESLARDKQLAAPLVQHNPARVRALLDAYRLPLDGAELDEPGLWGNTIVARRRDLADLARLQLYGVSWAATGIDQAIPAKYVARQSDFDTDVSWHGLTPPALPDDALTLDVLSAGIVRAGTVPVLLVNEPIYVSTGRNSALRYNAFYPRWAYDAYRARLRARAAAGGWRYVDLWDAVAPAEFTDTPVHLTPAGTRWRGRSDLQSSR